MALEIWQGGRGVSHGSIRSISDPGEACGPAPRQNQSLRYATHQLNMPMGIVANSDQKMGKAISATSPSTMKVVQKTLRCIPLF